MRFQSYPKQPKPGGNYANHIICVCSAEQVQDLFAFQLNKYNIMYLIFPQLGFALGVLTYWWKGLEQMFATPRSEPQPEGPAGPQR